LINESATGAVTAKPIRVLHCPTLTGGNSPQLARSERMLGLASWAVAFEQNYINYDCDEILWRADDCIVAREFKRWKLLYRALSSFDVVHFNCGLSILPNRVDAQPGPTSRLRGILRHLYRLYGRLFSLKDLPLLKRAGKAIFVTYQGSDARQMDYCRRHFEISFADEVPPGTYSAASDARKREDIGVFERYADGIFALNPDLLHVLPARAQFMPYASVDPARWRPPDYRPGARACPLVVHAPTRHGVKGTRFLLDAVNRLKSEGMDFEFVLVEKMSRAEARRIYERADLLVDQLLAGWYGAVAVEAMALGRPVVCYLRQDDLRFLDPGMRSDLPIINATPGTLCDTLRDLLGKRRHTLAEAGARSRNYVEKWHDPDTLAARMKNCYVAALSRTSRVTRN